MKIKTEDTVELFTLNDARRYLEWDKHPLWFRFLFSIPFYLGNSILGYFEHKYAVPCEWCGREYFNREKAKSCCAATKRRLGAKPGSIATIGGGCGGSLAYDSQRDIVIDGRGKEYVSRNRL